jgi:hypothetical protein
LAYSVGELGPKVRTIQIFGADPETVEIWDDAVVTDVIKSLLNDYQFPETYHMGLATVKNGDVRFLKGTDNVYQLPEDEDLYFTPKFEELFKYGFKIII